MIASAEEGEAVRKKQSETGSVEEREIPQGPMDPLPLLAAAQATPAGTPEAEVTAARVAEPEGIGG